MKTQVHSFDINVVDGDIFLHIHTDRKKPHKYRIWKDERHPDIFEVARHLNEGLTEAQRTRSKIEIREYLERMYVFIELPVDYHSNQYSAQAI